MAKFIVTYDAGFGATSEVVEVADQDQADLAAYEMWLEEAERNADYHAEPYTEERAKELGVE